MAGHSRPASQAVPGQRPAPGAQREGADPDLPGISSSPPPLDPQQPLPSPPLLLSFSQTGRSGCRPRGQRQGRAPLRRAHARASARGWSKQTLLKGHFFSSGSGSQRKLQSFFRAVNARRKTHRVPASLHAPRQPSAFSQGISLPNKDAFFKPEP